MVIMLLTTIRGPPWSGSLYSEPSSLGLSSWRETLAGLAPAYEEAAAIVLPNAFHDNWFSIDASLMASAATRTLLKEELYDWCSLLRAMDEEVLDDWIQALGRGLPSRVLMSR